MPALSATGNGLPPGPSMRMRLLTDLSVTSAGLEKPTVTLVQSGGIALPITRGRDHRPAPARGGAPRAVCAAAWWPAGRPPRDPWAGDPPPRSAHAAVAEEGANAFVTPLSPVSELRQRRGPREGVSGIGSGSDVDIMLVTTSLIASRRAAPRCWPSSNSQSRDPDGRHRSDPRPKCSSGRIRR